MDAEQIAAELWPGRDTAVEPLRGGITNHNFKLVVDGESYVLRIGGKDTELLGIDRAAEHEASVAAASLGIAPEGGAFRHGCLVTRFVQGEVGAPTPREAGALVHRLHDARAIPGRFDSFRVVEEYAAT